MKLYENKMKQKWKVPHPPNPWLSKCICQIQVIILISWKCISLIVSTIHQIKIILVHPVVVFKYILGIVFFPVSCHSKDLYAFWQILNHRLLRSVGPFHQKLWVLLWPTRTGHLRMSWLQLTPAQQYLSFKTDTEEQPLSVRSLWNNREVRPILLMLAKILAWKDLWGIWRYFIWPAAMAINFN